MKNKHRFIQRQASRLSATALLALAGAFTTSVSAATLPPPPLPPTDLGGTNILDGEGGPGALLEVIQSNYVAVELADGSGSKVPGHNAQQIFAGMLHPIVVSDKRIAGAYPGFDALIPYSHVRVNFEDGPQASATGIGDVTFAVSLQWLNLGKQAAPFAVRLGMQFVAPTGKYSPGNPVNSGDGGWQLSPYMAATWLVTERWEFSTRVIYDWSEKVKAALDPAGTSYSAQAGDFVAVNASASYAVVPVVRLGVGTYLLRQLAPSRADESAVPNSRQSVDAVGPLASWSVGHVTAFLAAYREFNAVNRTEGTSFSGRVLIHF